jgi:hypothetical protein
MSEFSQFILSSGMGQELKTQNLSPNILRADYYAKIKFLALGNIKLELIFKNI